MLSPRGHAMLGQFMGEMYGMGLQALLKELDACVDVEDHPKLGEQRVHFRSDSFHTGRYYFLQRALQHRSVCNLFALLLLNTMPDSIRQSITVLAGPERAAGPLMGTLKHYLPTKDVKTVMLVKRGRDSFAVPEWARIDPDDNVFLVDDIFHSGRTLKACINAIGSLVIGAAVGVNRAPDSWIEDGSVLTVPFFSVIRDPLVRVPANDCSWCRQKIKAVKV